MKIIAFLFCCSIGFLSCKQKNKIDQPTSSLPKDTVEAVSFFPVTSYLKGQLLDIGENHVNPLQYNIKNGKTDSAWLKIEDLPIVLASFFEPVIDTLNMVTYFKEEKFNDQSVDAFTFTYNPIGKLPDSMKLRHWDVYVDPKTNRVRRVYILKELAKNKQQQLTWQADEKWCKITNISTDSVGKFAVESEKKVTWNF